VKNEIDYENHHCSFEIINLSLIIYCLGKKSYQISAEEKMSRKRSAVEQAGAAAAAGNWCLIESDPGVFTELIRGFGVKGLFLHTFTILNGNERNVFNLDEIWKYLQIMVKKQRFLLRNKIKLKKVRGNNQTKNCLLR
jgi:hypothetical protein